MSPGAAQNNRASDWEFWEKQTNLPKFWYGDICDIKREGETINLQCTDIDVLGPTCFSGEMTDLYTGFYGYV